MANRPESVEIKVITGSCPNKVNFFRARARAHAELSQPLFPMRGRPVASGGFTSLDTQGEIC